MSMMTKFLIQGVFLLSLATISIASSDESLTRMQREKRARKMRRTPPVSKKINYCPNYSKFSDADRVMKLRMHQASDPSNLEKKIFVFDRKAEDDYENGTDSSFDHMWVEVKMVKAYQGKFVCEAVDKPFYDKEPT